MSGSLDHLPTRAPRLCNESRIAIHTWQRTNLDERGYFVTTKHVVVTLILECIRAVRLDDFNHQNVNSWLSLEETEAGYMNST